MTTRLALAFSLSLFVVGACGSDAGPPPVKFGGDRPTFLQVPVDYDASQAYPLLMILHGYSANSYIQQAYLGFAGAADARHILILAPDGKVDSTGNQFWNASDACCDLDKTGVDDVAYLGGLLDEVKAAYHVDPTRVFVIGHSNGGFMSYRLACERSDVITGIMSLAGAAAFDDAKTCVPDQPVSVLSLHGDADALVPYAGGMIPGDVFPAAPGAVASVERWATYDGCGAMADGGTLDVDGKLPGKETSIQAASGCPGATGVELWTMHGGGHIPTLRQPDTADAIYAWLDAHAR